MSAQGRGGPKPSAAPWGAGSLGGPPSTRGLPKGWDPVASTPLGWMEGWESLSGTEEVEGWGFFFFFFSKRSTEPRSPPPLQLPSPLSTCTLQGAKAFWQAFRSGFYWFQLSCPFRRVGKLQSLKEKKKKKNKEGKESIMHPSPCCPFPLPRWPHTTHPDFPSPSNAFEAGFSRPWISPTVPAWLQSPSCSEAI